MRAAGTNLRQQTGRISAHQVATDKDQFVVFPVTGAVVLHTPCLGKLLTGFQNGSIRDAQILEQSCGHRAGGWCVVVPMALQPGGWYRVGVGRISCSSMTFTITATCPVVEFYPVDRV